ncbi:uncharacterized protein METZ01_LOCUS95938 [marine metagenome]|uniref:DUF6644 domain-containing protein n=1 Tax=marine metagenome TaxID=408172 RepID=A0A381VS57_9ZZZZ|tara:strand:- start:5164 stop:5661 length:498 start_codon:yes stop_codon:yes gene_type:complete
MSPLELFEWLGNTPWSIALLESLWVYPIVETTHVLTLCLFLGLIATLDLRLVGLTLRRVPVSEVAGRLLPWALGGFALMAVSGLLLFYSHPVRAYENIFFRIKIVMLVLAGLNAFVFHTTVYRRVTDWDRAPIAPLRARVAGYLSLVLWCGVVVGGRMQAYNWFN